MRARRQLPAPPPPFLLCGHGPSGRTNVVKEVLNVTTEKSHLRTHAHHERDHEALKDVRQWQIRQVDVILPSSPAPPRYHRRLTMSGRKRGSVVHATPQPRAPTRHTTYGGRQKLDWERFEDRSAVRDKVAVRNHGTLGEPRRAARVANGRCEQSHRRGVPGPGACFIVSRRA